MIFWAAGFFTSVIGIIELLPELENIKRSLGHFILISGLYWALVLLISLSIFNCIRIIRENVNYVNSGMLGEELKEYAKNNPTPIDQILVGDDGEVKNNIEYYIILLVIIAYLLLYLVKAEIIVIN